jgi:WD repeat-containing protein 48
MIKRDEAYRKQLAQNPSNEGPIQRGKPPTSIQIPSAIITSWPNGGNGAIIPRGNGNHYPMTPGMGIGVATPAAVNVLPGVPEDGAPLEKKVSHVSRTSAERSGDYFMSAPIAAVAENVKPAATTTETQEEKTPVPASETEKEANGKESSTLFGKKFRMGMSFGSKKLGRSASTATEKPVVVDEKSEGSETSETKEEEVDDSFHGIVQTIHMDYDKQLLENPDKPLESGITPSLPNETPVLKPPPLTTVIIQEETSGGSADLYRGTVATLGDDASLIEERAPMWLGDLLLRVNCRSDAVTYTVGLTMLVEQDTNQRACKGLICASTMARSIAQYCWS